MAYDGGQEKRVVKSPGKSRRQKGVGNKRQAVRWHKCDIRLNSDENAVLDRLADRYEVSRSDVMRRALRDFAKFTVEEE